MEILPSPNSKSLEANICGRQHFCRPWRFQQLPCYCRILWDANIFDGAPIFHVGADISWALIFHGRQYFMDANISWTPIFHGRQYFMDANISWTLIFHGHQYFMDANISWTPIFHGRQYFMDANILT